LSSRFGAIFAAADASYLSRDVPLAGEVKMAVPGDDGRPLSVENLYVVEAGSARRRRPEYQFRSTTASAMPRDLVALLGLLAVVESIFRSALDGTAL
jgi:hypothetical protein